MSVGDASGAEDQYSLLVLPGDAVAGWGFGRRRFREGFVDGSHCRLSLLCKLWRVCAFGASLQGSW